jgi:GST-like protein
MQDLTAYLWATPNSRRVSVLFAELGLDYAVRTVNIRAGEQHSPEVSALNPAGKIPIVTWSEGGTPHRLFESGAILISFAQRFGRFLPASSAERDEVMCWLMLVLTGLGAATGQAHHWRQLAGDANPAAIAFAEAATRRIYRTLDDRLAGQGYLAGDYSIADIAAYPWVERHLWAGLTLADYPAVHRWFDQVGQRPAVERGMRVPDGVVLA